MGHDDGTFKPDDAITRAEFVAMCVRFYELTDDVTTGSTNKFSDVASSHWAYSYINSAVAMDWIEGYSDGTFRPDNNITRAEVVTIVNRVTEREADTDYISDNLNELNSFSDVKDKSYWAYYDIFEAANEHKAMTVDGVEAWVE